jgi:hypothetical protein
MNAEQANQPQHSTRWCTPEHGQGRPTLTGQGAASRTRIGDQQPGSDMGSVRHATDARAAQASRQPYARQVAP